MCKSVEEENPIPVPVTVDEDTEPTSGDWDRFKRFQNEIRDPSNGGEIPLN